MTSTAFAPSSPASVIAEARVLVGELHEVLWAAKTPREKLDAVAEVERLRSELAAIEAEVVAEVEATRAAAHDQWGSTGDYLTSVSGGFQGSGGATVRLAKALTGDRAATLDGLRSGSISQAQARVVVATVDALPTRPDLRDLAEKTMLEHARRFNATELKAIGAKLVETLDPIAFSSVA